ncbi:hypothetical protein BC629DRAFT_1628448 [Irpex lacteus]|nr:hypothetical protein BC629DRAFT_1628448 [Irpex lacteus]
MAEIHDQFETILILDLAPRSPSITRRCRELNVYAELMPCTQKIKDLKFKPKAPHVDPAVFELGVPVLGICYGLQEMAWNMKGKVTKCDHREYGFAQLQVRKFEGASSGHNRALTKHRSFAAIAHNSKPFYGIQFHAEVTHSTQANNARRMDHEFIGKEIARIRQICGPKGRVIGAVSGGVDSTVAAKLMHEAIGDRFHAIMVDNGVLRLNEGAQVHKMLNEDLGVNLTVVDASELFLSRLKDVEDPEQKRKIIGNTFINVFEQEAAKIEAAAEEEEKKGAEAKGKIEWLLQGTLYPDVIESISFKGPSATIKTHHNLKLIEPLRELFKGARSACARTSPSIPSHLVQRHPFPGPGLAIRILGPVTREQVKILQKADNIYIEEIRRRALKAVGVMGDKRTYEQVIALRAVTSEDFMTADWYVFPPEVEGINRVTYDISSKPPAVSLHIRSTSGVGTNERGRPLSGCRLARAAISILQ